jgi:lambda family phage portal protein
VRRNPLLAASDELDRTTRFKAPTSFAGAQVTRLTADWAAGLFSADQEIRSDLSTLRARARTLVRNNSHASGFVNELATNVIGPDGIMLQAKVRTTGGDLVKRTNDEIERGWREWSMPENASADGHDDWVESQRMIIKTIAVEGEIFIRRLKYFDNDFGYTLQVIDADLVDDRFNRPASETANAVKMGVEVNQWNRPVAYHVWTRHMGDQGPRERVRISANEITHLFIRYRAESDARRLLVRASAA